MTTITATFDNRSDAERAVSALEARGIQHSEISLIVSDTAHQTLFKDVDAEDRLSSSAKGAGTGAAIGGSLAAIVAGLTAVGSVVIPGAGLLAVGPLVAFFAGGGAGAAAGGLAGALIGAGVPDAEASVYENEVKKGRALVSVHTDDSSKVTAAREILKAYNPSYKAA